MSTTKNITFTNVKNASKTFKVVKKSINLSTSVIANTKSEIIKQASAQGVKLDYSNITLISDAAPTKKQKEDAKKVVTTTSKPAKQVNPNKALVTPYTLLQLKLDIAKHNTTISEKVKKSLDDVKSIVTRYKNSVATLSNTPMLFNKGTQYNAMDINARQVFAFYYLSLIELNNKEDILYKRISSVKTNISDAIKDIEDNLDTPADATYTIEYIEEEQKKLVAFNNQLATVRSINRISKSKLYNFLPKGLYNLYVAYIDELKNVNNNDVKTTSEYKAYFRCIYDWFISMGVTPSENEIDRLIRLVGIAGYNSNLRKNNKTLTYIFSIENFVNSFVHVIIERLIKQRVVNLDVIKEVKCKKLSDSIINILADKIVNFYNGENIYTDVDTMYNFHILQLNNTKFVDDYKSYYNDIKTLDASDDDKIELLCDYFNELMNTK